MPKVVYSKTLTPAGWDTTITRDVVRAEVEELKAPGPWGALADDGMGSLGKKVKDT